MRIAIIGAGISGLLAARLLADDHDIHVFEANGYAGGHTNTVAFEAFGQPYAADTGFMVFNDRTYPNFVRLLQMLDVPARISDMSFSVRCDKTGLEYQGSSLNGLFAQRRNLLRPAGRFPWLTARVIQAIHWQAFRLWRKKCPFYPHPQHRQGAEAQAP